MQASERKKTEKKKKHTHKQSAGIKKREFVAQKRVIKCPLIVHARAKDVHTLPPTLAHIRPERNEN